MGRPDRAMLAPSTVPCLGQRRREARARDPVMPEPTVLPALGAEHSATARSRVPRGQRRASGDALGVGQRGGQNQAPRLARGSRQRWARACRDALVEDPATTGPRIRPCTGQGSRDPRIADPARLGQRLPPMLGSRRAVRAKATRCLDPGPMLRPQIPAAAGLSCDVWAVSRTAVWPRHGAWVSTAALSWQAAGRIKAQCRSDEPNHGARWHAPVEMAARS